MGAFRQMQDLLIGAIDFIHGFGMLPDSRPTFNDFLDLQYRVLGVLAGGLASNEKRLVRFSDSWPGRRECFLPQAAGSHQLLDPEGSWPPSYGEKDDPAPQ